MLRFGGTGPEWRSGTRNNTARHKTPQTNPAINRGERQMSNGMSSKRLMPMANPDAQSRPECVGRLPVALYSAGISRLPRTAKTERLLRYRTQITTTESDAYRKPRFKKNVTCSPSPRQRSRDCGAFGLRHLGLTGHWALAIGVLLLGGLVPGGGGHEAEAVLDVFQPTALKHGVRPELLEQSQLLAVQQCAVQSEPIGGR